MLLIKLVIELLLWIVLAAKSDVKTIDYAALIILSFSMGISASVLIPKDNA